MQLRSAASVLVVLFNVVSSFEAFGLPATQGHSIPKIIHQSWKVDKLPAKLVRWQETMRCGSHVTLYPSEMKSHRLGKTHLKKVQAVASLKP